MSFIDDVLGPSGALARALPGYEHRAEQLELAHAVDAAITHGRALLAEAGTGTGKTLAYLVPALRAGKKVVISTGTKHLQEQIVGKDVPLLARALGEPVEAVLLKGISNYLCRRRFAEVGETTDPDLVQITSWARKTATGDRAELTAVPDDAPAWKLVTTTPDARLGPRCPYFERCFVTQARRAAARASIIIVNHHLYFADAALRASFAGATVLPEHDVVVFDEAHQLEDVATEHFGLGVSTLRLLGLLRDARAALTVSTLTHPVPAEDLRSAAALIGNFDARTEAFFALVRRRLGRLADDARVAMPGDLFDDADRKDAWFHLDAALEELAAHAGRRASDAVLASDDESAGEDAAAVARRARAVRDDLAELADTGPTAARRLVRWVEVRGKSVFLGASPIDVAPLLREHVLAGRTAVFTSATLAAGGTFAYARERLGLPEDDADALRVDSPFDYPRQSLLYLPRDLPLPSDPAFSAAALARTAELIAITRGHAFVLFTSHRALRNAAVSLKPLLPAPYPIFVQGDAPRSALLESFRTTPHSILLATSSFWEGVDVPGAALSLVVIEKLPFAAPDDPITAARVARLDERGVDAFATYQVPRAAIALKQGFGRLIRSRSDRGLVAILDHRILSKAYGRTFLASLPPAARTSSLEQARRWFYPQGDGVNH